MLVIMSTSGDLVADLFQWRGAVFRPDPSRALYRVHRVHAWQPRCDARA